MGLSPQEQGELHQMDDSFPGGAVARRSRIAQLRSRYRNSPQAQQQLDVFEGGDNQYHQKLRLLIAAITKGDEVAQAELLAWFRKYYPDIPAPGER